MILIEITAQGRVCYVHFEKNQTAPIGAMNEVNHAVRS